MYKASPNEIPLNRWTAIDEGVYRELAPFYEAARGGVAPAVGDVATRRRNGRRMFEHAARARSVRGAVQVERVAIPASDGAKIGAHLYSDADRTRPRAGVLYLHGGGMILGLDELGKYYDRVVREYVVASGVSMLLVDYRVAPEFSYPVPVRDCQAALDWLACNAQSYGIDAERLGVMGDSAGGGLAAALCMLARDRGGPAISQQILVYPMLDDQTTTPRCPRTPVAKYLTWTYDDNATGWSALLGEPSSRLVEPEAYAVPARATSVRALPPTYLDVGGLDIFLSENLEYARQLDRAGVPVELHVHPGCPHAFDAFAPAAGASRRAVADRIRRLENL